jgi:alkylation response protein AidB-like acyl-CoA dehydrogenase
MELDDFRAGAATWLAANRDSAPRDYGAILPPDLRDEGMAWQARLFAAGWAGIHWPVEHGGRGLTPEHNAAWIEECALASVPPFINMVGVVLAGGSIMLFGTAEQQAEHLRPILTGERVWCQLFSEPGAGSDLASLTTSAELDGDEYVLTGQKVWCSNGRISDRGICLARTDPTAAPHKGISFFLVDMGSPGVEVRPLRQMTGGSEFDEVFLDGVRVPLTDRLGPENEGWSVAMATLTNERGHIGASAISLQRRLDAMADTATGAGSAVTRNDLSGLLARGNAFLALSGRQGPVASVAASLMKLGVTELLFDAAMTRATLTGAHGMLDGATAAGVLGAPAGRIAGGTTEVQRNIIGERILGLPKEPRR